MSSRISVRIAETSSEPRHPRRFEKKTNKGGPPPRAVIGERRAYPAVGHGNRCVAGRNPPRGYSRPVSESLGVAVLAGAVRAVGKALGADRCWLYARDPEAGAGVALVRWLRAADVTDVPDELREWTREAPDLAQTDPLFARALAGIAADAIADVTTADVHRPLEAALGHRAFVHLNLQHDGRLVGVLQPGMTDAPRIWTELDDLIALRPALAALTAAAVKRGRPAGVRLVG
jgi:GAF domain-containing protein